MAEMRKHLVFAIIKFLEEQVKSGDLKEEDLESLEVASQCLETAFGLDQPNKDELSAKFPLPGSLLEIFQQGLQFMAPPKRGQPTPADKEAADKLKGEGNDFMKADKVNEAVDCYSRAIELDPNNSVYYCNRAAAFNKLNQFECAIEDCSVALELDPQYSKAHNRKGVAHMALHQFQEAKTSFNKALELDPQNESYKQSLEQAEQKVQEAEQRAGPSAGGGGLGGLNLAGINLPAMLNNPALMNMAQSMMSNPSMQQMMANVMMGAQGNQEGGEGISSLLQAGQQLAQEVQARNPELVDQLRNQMRPDGSQPGNPDTPSDNSKGTDGAS